MGREGLEDNIKMNLSVLSGDNANWIIHGLHTHTYVSVQLAGLYGSETEA
jgi:hypothetical protein